MLTDSNVTRALSLPLLMLMACTDSSTGLEGLSDDLADAGCTLGTINVELALSDALHYSSSRDFGRSRTRPASFT
jgi:hypothetical protein